MATGKLFEGQRGRVGRVVAMSRGFDWSRMMRESEPRIFATLQAQKWTEMTARRCGDAETRRGGGRNSGPNGRRLKYGGRSGVDGATDERW